MTVPAAHARPRRRHPVETGSVKVSDGMILGVGDPSVGKTCAYCTLPMQVGEVVACSGWRHARCG